MKKTHRSQASPTAEGPSPSRAERTRARADATPSSPKRAKPTSTPASAAKATAASGARAKPATSGRAKSAASGRAKPAGSGAHAKPGANGARAKPTTPEERLPKAAAPDETPRSAKGRAAPRTKMPPERPGQPGGKRARNREARVQATLDAALRLFLERGVESVTIDDIAREAGMAKGNFYRYFDDKRAVVDALIAPMAADVRTAMRKCAVALGRAGESASPEALAAAYAMLAMDLAQATVTRLDVMRLYLQENRAPATPSTAGVHALADELADGAIHLSELAVDHGLLRIADPRVSALAVVGAFERLSLAVLRGQLDTPPLEAARIVTSMVLDGIRAR